MATQHIFKSIFLWICLSVVIALPNVVFAESKPTEKEAINVLQEYFNEGINSKLFHINKVRKTDGQDVNLGIQMYIMYFEAELEFLKDTAICGGSFIPAAKYNAMGILEKNARCHGPDKIFNSSERLKITGTITFKKSERGWRNGKVEIE